MHTHTQTNLQDTPPRGHRLVLVRTGGGGVHGRLACFCCIYSCGIWALFSLIIIGYV